MCVIEKMKSEWKGHPEGWLFLWGVCSWISFSIHSAVSRVVIFSTIGSETNLTRRKPAPLPGRW